MPVSTTQASVDPLMGTRIDGRYTVRGLLGRGAQAVVYDGIHDELARPVAIKVLDASWAAESSAVTRFLREARTASALSHSHIVDVSDLGRLSDGRPYLVMPKVAGMPLGDLLAAEGPQPAQRVASLLAGVGSALDLIHARGFVHRDIKPENLMFVRQEDGTETVVMLDFGIAIASNAQAPRLTQRNTVFGTPAYMPPEVRDRKLPDGRGDVYALATVAFELLTGKVPFERENPLELLALKSTLPAPRLSDIAGDRFSAGLEAVFARGLARDPNDRPATAGVFIAALQLAADGGDPHLVDLEASAQPRRKTQSPVRAALGRAGARFTTQLRGAVNPGSRPHHRTMALRVGGWRTPRWKEVAVVVGIGLAIAIPGRFSSRTPRAAVHAVHSATPQVRSASASGLPAAAPIMAPEPATKPAPVAEATPRGAFVPPLGAASSAAPKAGPVAEAPGPTAAKPTTAKPSATKSPKPSETKSEVTAATKRAAHSPPIAASAKTRKPKAPAVDEAVVEQQVSAGTAALLANHPEEAAAQFRSAIARDGNNAHAWRGLGLALERKHDTVSALGAYQRYLSLSSPGPQQDAVRKRMRALEP